MRRSPLPECSFTRDACMTHRRSLILLAGMIAGGGGAAHGQGQPDYEQPPVSYSATAPRDAMARLQDLKDYKGKGGGRVTAVCSAMQQF
jgi:hypothetical protein